MPKDQLMPQGEMGLRAAVRDSAREQTIQEADGGPAHAAQVQGQGGQLRRKQLSERNTVHADDSTIAGDGDA